MRNNLNPSVTSSDTVAVTLSGLGRQYGDFWAVEPLDLEVRQGEFVSLLGPSGCGKTTLLRMIAGFTQPSCGSIQISGRDVTALRPEDRGISIVVQNYAIFPAMNVFENVAFGLRVRKTPRSEIEDRVKAALEQVGLSGLEGRFHNELSGGQKQRVALARAIVTEPGLLLLDEPLSALDARIRAEMRAWLKELQHELGITTVFVTHDQEEALSMSDRVAVLNAGRIEQIDAPRAIYETPQTEFVASFIGEANLLAGRVLGPDRVEVDVLGEFEAATGKLAKGSRIKVILRPEHLTVEPCRQGPATLTAVDYGGGHSFLRLLAGDQSFLVGQSGHPGMSANEPGMSMKLSVIPGTAFVLKDVESANAYRS